MSTISPSRYVPYGFARAHQVLVAGTTSDAVEVWIGEATPPAALAELSRTLPLRLVTVRKEEDELRAAISKAYSQQEGSAAAVADEVASDLDLSRLMQDIPRIEDLLETEDDAPIIRMINALLTQASRDGASDIHIEPFESYSLVRFRVDGTLRDVVRPRREIHAALISRIKIMAQLDIAEKRLPQDGRITLRIGGRPVDVRVSTLPTGHGERAVLRLLDKEAGRLDLARLGLSKHHQEQFDTLIRAPHGIVLVTGPTGSGKTTTLYSTLKQLATDEVNVCTVEDPIEMIDPAFNQTQVQNSIDLTFAAGVRSLMRQDPDIIMIGEIRDLETAEMATQAALTGHLVLSTLHTNDAPSAVTRLIELGVPGYLLNATLVGVLAQRLVRTLCPSCKVVDDSVSEERWNALIKPFSAAAPKSVYRPVGCLECRMTGYRGRAGIYELLGVEDAIRRELAEDRPSLDRIRHRGMKGGMKPLRLAGAQKIAAGQTTFDEVLKVAPSV